MKSIEKFAELMSCTTELNWRNKIFRFSHSMGFDRTLLAILPGRESKPEAQYAFLQSNYSPEWCAKYDAEQMSYIDPIVAHSLCKTIPLIWTPELFAKPRQREMYEEACSYGLRSGITLPIRGNEGEIGMLCLVSDAKPDEKLEAEICQQLAEMCLFRDFVSESSHRFAKRITHAARQVRLTRRELECLKFCATGKSSWEIAKILNCSLSNVNYHFANIRDKLETTSRSQSLIRAVQLGLIEPA